MSPGEMVTMNDTEARTVYPDIIIHHRGTDDNLVVIEIKKTTSQEANDFDRRKLLAFREQLRYCHAVALLLKTSCNELGKYEMEFV